MHSSLTDIVLRNLQLIRSRTPSVAEANSWVEEFNRKIGSIDPERLQMAFDAAREESAGSGRFRPLHFDDILRAFRRTLSTDRREQDAPPSVPNCPRKCGDGKVVVLDEKQYSTVALCTCAAGQWWGSLPAWSQYPTVLELLRRPGYTEPERAGVSQAQADWLLNRTGQVGVKVAMEEFTAEMDRRAGR